MEQIELTSQDGTPIAAQHGGVGSPMVLVHGSFGGLDSWSPVLAELDGEFATWSYARRGYPPSGAGRDGNTFDDDVADLAAVVAAADGRPHLVGGSHGATVALHAVRAAAVDVASLTIFEPSLYAAGPALADTLTRFRYLLRRERAAEALRTFLSEVARMPEPLLPPADGPVTDQTRVLLTGALRDLEAMVADTTDLQRWGSLTVPTLLVHGELTWAPMPETMSALYAALPAGSRRVVLAGQTHFAPQQAPAQFAAALRAFVQTSTAP